MTIPTDPLLFISLHRAKTAALRALKRDRGDDVRACIDYFKLLVITAPRHIADDARSSAEYYTQALIRAEGRV